MATTLFDSRDGRVKEIALRLVSAAALLIPFCAAMAQSQQQTRVVVIDDDEMSRDLLVLLFEAAGYAVSAAESGEAALALLESAPAPAVILADIQMPGSAPEQLAGRLRRACGRRTLLLAMSGSRPSDATLSHFDGFLLKPFGAADISAAIQVHRSEHLKTSPAKSPRARDASSAAGPARNTTAALHSLAASGGGSSTTSRADADRRRTRTAAAAIAPPPVVDETIYRQLAASMPGPQLHQMYSMCIGDARARIAEMRSFAAANDIGEFKRQAHAIKGSSGMLGASELHRMAAALETHGPAPSATGVNSLDELANACDRLERMLGARA